MKKSSLFAAFLAVATLVVAGFAATGSTSAKAPAAGDCCTGGACCGSGACCHN